ncbi:hypothetical protein GGR42_001447 [Saonia flava]|uniref:Lipocalin-like domain-containing protein n=1 Tax=Saonia flava TaxID=523696 RepID=A0A846QZA6_9FLAO|nr:lipocalin family protein [Saonia flava]NJB70985.1 hypothetical protein [Saonia flava]
MKRNLMLFFVASTILLSCSKDKDATNDEQQNSIVGTWDIAELRVDEGSTDDDLLFAAGIVDVLVAQNCGVVSLVFEQNGTLSTRNGVNNVEVDLNSQGNGLSIPCPDTFETETTTWSLEGNQLTVIDGNGVEQMSTIQLNGGTLIVAGEEVSEDNFTGADIVFTKR